jgi:hypothetical protein
MKCATAVLTSAKQELEWFGQKGELMLPKFLPDLPKREQDRLEAFVEGEALKIWKGVERAHKAKSARRQAAKRKGARI